MDKKEEHQVASKEKSQQVSEQEVIIPKENGEAEAAREQLIRLQADFDNYKKRMIKKEAEFLLRANERLLGNILPIVNDLARALEAKGIKDSDHNTLKGVKMIHDKLLQMLAKEEVEPIQAQEGDVIDNEEFVEAISA
ncbi:MAG: nucleotide exchange factor GrpE, partial [Bacteroidota bacterium]